MNFSFKEIKCEPPFFKNPYIGFKDRVQAVIKEYLVVGHSKNFGNKSPVKLILIFIRWDYKMRHHNSLVLDFICDVYYYLEYETLDNSEKVINELLDDSYRRASEEFYNQIKNEKTNIRLPKFNKEQQKQLQLQIMEGLYL